MKYKVTLYNSGQLIEEILTARDSKEAERGALNRNPGSTVYSTTGYFHDDDTRRSSYSSSSSSNNSSSGGSSRRESSGDGISASALIGLLLIVGAFWVFITYTPFVVMGVLGAVGAWIGSKFENKFVALILTVVLGGLGFYLGTDWANQVESRIDESERVEEAKSVPDGNSTSNSTLLRDSKKNTPAPQIIKPRELTKKEKDCQIWRNAFPDAAAKLKQGDSCYEYKVNY